MMSKGPSKKKYVCPSFRDSGYCVLGELCSHSHENPDNDYSIFREDSSTSRSSPKRQTSTKNPKQSPAHDSPFPENSPRKFVNVKVNIQKDQVEVISSVELPAAREVTVKFNKDANKFEEQTKPPSGRNRASKPNKGRLWGNEVPSTENIDWYSADVTWEEVEDGTSKKLDDNVPQEDFATWEPPTWKPLSPTWEPLSPTQAPAKQPTSVDKRTESQSSQSRHTSSVPTSVSESVRSPPISRSDIERPPQSKHLPRSSGKATTVRERVDVIEPPQQTKQSSRSSGKVSKVLEQADTLPFRKISIIPTPEEIIPQGIPLPPEPGEDEFDSMVSDDEYKEIYREITATYHKKDQEQIKALPSNITSEPYNSIEDYLYTHFSLLRADCTIPLRNAVRAYRLSLLPGVKLENQPFRVYERVKPTTLISASAALHTRITFRLPHGVRVKWGYSKRLIPGTLVVLSPDKFTKKVIFGTVSDRSLEVLLLRGSLELCIDLKCERVEDWTEFWSGEGIWGERADEIVMIEAHNGYFEAYRHILRVLQSLNPATLPFANHFIELDSKIQSPKYLRTDLASKKHFFDFSVVFPDIEKRIGKKTLDILAERDEWSALRKNMDDTQLSALQRILSKSLAIIQGPPGTGKTYVGLMAARLLIHNIIDRPLPQQTFSSDDDDDEYGSPGPWQTARDLRTRRAFKSISKEVKEKDILINKTPPIICVCQTNHALDQFLDALHKYYNDESDIIRIGSRSQSSIMKERTLYEIRKRQPPMSKDRQRIISLFRERDDLERSIRNLLKEMEQSPCVELDFIKKHGLLKPKQINMLEKGGITSKDAVQAPGSWDEECEIEDEAEEGDSDDEWEINWVPGQKKSTTKKNENMKPNAIHQRGTQGRTERGRGVKRGDNQPLEDTKPNPVSNWLRDAITVATDENYEEDMDENEFVDFQKGFEIDAEEEVDDEQLEELKEEFHADDESSRVRDGLYEFASGPFYRGDLRQIIPKVRTSPDDAVKRRDCLRMDNVFKWPLHIRVAVHTEWKEKRNAEIRKELAALATKCELVGAKIKKENAINDARICMKAKVVGMTSTAAAKYRDLMEAISPTIIIIEEAAETLEAHIVTCLPPSVQHLILIGDHQQLRPTPSVYQLADMHYLDMSLFERLVNNDIPFTRLSYQRRMRPEIRKLLDPIYEQLEDHPDVTTYKNMVGMATNVHFLTHEQMEEVVTDTSTKANPHEAKMASRLALYLLMQRCYSPKDITILTMYAGQRKLIKDELRELSYNNPSCKDVRVSSVDGFQGEESDIIILSLVRSNETSKIGFLGVSNRICVSLSRARKGLYIMGNAGMLMDGSQLWRDIIAVLQRKSGEKDSDHKPLSNSLVFECQNHRGHYSIVRFPEDFHSVEEGGCDKDCKETLSCGHRCVRKCHIYPHSEVRCQSICGKILPCGHTCQNECFKCSRGCGECIVKVHVLLKCHHDTTMTCKQRRKFIENDISDIFCDTCEKTNKPIRGFFQ